MRVLISDPISPDSVETLKSSGDFDVDLIPDLDEDALVEVVPPYHAMVVRSRTKVTRRIIEAAKELKIIVRGGVGLDNIDQEAAREKGVAVANTPGTNSESVAELTLGLMLCLARRIPQAHIGLAAGRWEKKKFRGYELGGKTLGIIGMGRIGRSLSGKAVSLGMHVLGFDPEVKDEDVISAGAKPVTIEELRKSSDYISIHVPLLPETRNLIGAEFLAGTRDGVYIINCARGGVVDEKALLDAIDSGKVAGAALDVFEEEPPGRSPLFERDCVIGTPHIGAATFEAQRRVGEAVVNILLDFFSKK